MARLLTKLTLSGVRYTRPALIEDEIDAALKQEPPRLTQRAACTDHHSEDFLSSEALVHLIRETARNGAEALQNSLVSALLKRCALALSKHPDRVGQETLDHLVDLLATAACDESDLDFFEVRFNLAFKTARLNVERGISADLNALALVLPEEASRTNDRSKAKAEEPGPAELNPEQAMMRQQLIDRINRLPEHLRNAVTLVHIFEYCVESEDPLVETAATKCGVTGRTIRTWLVQAREELKRMEEES